MAQGWDLERDRIDRATWARFLARAEPAALQQSWAYGEAARGDGARPRRWAIRRGGRLCAVAQWLERRWALGARALLLNRGPVWMADIEPGARAGAFEAMARAIRAEHPLAFLLATPEAGAAETCAMRAARFRKTMTGPTHAVIDLAAGADRARLRGKWRNMLRRAEDARIRIETPSAGALLDWLLERCDRQQREKRYRGPSGAFARRLIDADPAASLALIALDGSEPIAGMWFLASPRGASHLLGATTEKGRARRAHHLLLWRAIERFAERGLDVLDLGGIDTERAPGLARFKLGAGARALVLPGLWTRDPLFDRW